MWCISLGRAETPAPRFLVPDAQMVVTLNRLVCILFEHQNYVIW